ncbi:protein IWS1 homolog A [Xyrichtys novacula]|uniref:Protein IWS1 homolog A n=1 Tax=Xyrichtys novacula TaxID=13765 RepID=A0AAV1HB24_XYRNO|nr:protein IWS1 homolog A [Xyrichtys novacula]
MGNCCCQAESPCGSAEERSVLLKNDSKTTVTSGETTVGGTCGPGGDDDIRKPLSEDKLKVEIKAEAVLVKQSAEVAEKELNNAQENGPLQKEATQTTASSPGRGSELHENSSRAQDEDEDKKECHPAEVEHPKPLQCTLHSPQKELTTADWDVPPATNTAEEKVASPQDKVPDSRVVTANAACPENHPEVNTTEHMKLDTPPDNDEETSSKVTIDEAAAEPSGESSQNSQVLSVPNSQQLCAAADIQVSPVSAVGQEVDGEAQKESPNRVISESSPACTEADAQVTKSHDASESSSGPHPAGLDHSGQEQDSANSVRESETTALTESSESSKPDQDANPDLDSKEVAALESVQQDIDEEVNLKEQGKDEDVPGVKEEKEMKEEAETAAVKDTEVEEVTDKEEQLTEGTSADVKADETMRPEKEESPGDSLGNSDEDLYRGAEELPASQKNKPSETTFLKLEDRCSLAPAVDILSYSEREWKGNTAKSALIRKGYKEMSQRFGSLRRVRGDNYCALRATLFQVLSHSTQLPEWLQEEDITTLPKQLEAQEGLISQWTFPGECVQGDGTGDAIAQLEGYVELLRNKVEMFLLGYALQCTIQVYRLYKADTEEFVTYYPDDHKDDWPSMCLVTEDDRHYNVPVVEVSELHEDADSS